MGKALTANDRQVITTTQVGLFNVTQCDRVITIAKINPVNAVAKINADVFLRRVKHQRLICQATDQLGFRRLTAVCIKVLSKDAIITVGDILIVALPGNNKTAVTEAGDRRILLILVGLRIDAEVVTNNVPIRIKHLTPDIIIVAAICPTTVSPRNNKATILKRRDHGLVLL